MAKYHIVVKDKTTDKTIGEFVKVADKTKELPRLHALLDVAEELFGKRNIFMLATKVKYTVKEI